MIRAAFLSKHLYTTLTIFFVGLLLSRILPLSGFVILISVFAIILPRVFSLPVRLGLAFLLYSSYAIATYFILTITHIELPPVLFLGIPLAIGLLFWTRSPLRDVFKESITREDIPAIFLGAIAMLFILLPVYHLKPGFVITALSSGEDNASHYALYNYAYKHNAYAYFSTNDTSGLIPGVSSYPQGSHITEASISRLKRLPASNQAIAPINFYYLQLAALYGLSVFFISVLIFRTLSALSKRTFTAAVVASIPALALFILAGPYLLLFTWGFQSQIFAMLLLAALLVVLSTDKKFNLTKPGFWLLCLLLIAMTSHIWYFITPLAVITFLITERKNFTKQFIFHTHRKWLAGYALLLIFMVVPIIISVAAGVSVGQATAAGGAANLSYWWKAAFVVAAVLSLVLRKPLLANPAARIAFISFWVTTGFISLLAFYQLSTVHYFSYYFYKSLYFLVGPAIAIGTATLACILERLQRVSRNALIPASIIVCLVSIGLIILIKPTYPRVYWHRWVPAAADAFQMDRIIESPRSSDVIFAGGCSRVYNYINNRWTGALLLTDNRPRAEYGFANIMAKESDKELKNYIDSPSSLSKKVLYQTKCDDPFDHARPIKKTFDKELLIFE